MLHGVHLHFHTGHCGFAHRGVALWLLPIVSGSLHTGRPIAGAVRCRLATPGSIPLRTVVLGTQRALLRYSTLWVSQRARSQTLCLSLPPQRLASTLLRALLSGLSTLRCGGRSDSGAGCHTRGVSLAWSPLSQALFALRFRHALTLLVTFLAAAGRGSPFTGFRFELLLRSGSTLVVGCQSDRGVAAVALHSTFLPARCGITPVPLKASCLRVGSYGA